MRILVVNGNTSAQVTQTIEAESKKAASPGTEIAVATARFGAGIVKTRAANAVAAHAVLDAIARHADGADAVLIGISFDTALDAARELLPVPVVGMTEAALRAASAHDGKIGLIVFGADTAPLYQDLVRGYGLASRVTLAPLAAGAAAAAEDPQRFDAAVAELARALAGKTVKSIVVAGAVAAGMARRIAGQVQVPVFDGIAAGIKTAETLTRLGAKAKPGADPVETSGLDPALMALFRGTH